MAAARKKSLAKKAPAKKAATRKRAPALNPRPSRHPTMDIPAPWQSVLEQVRAIVAELSDVEEFLSWGHPVWKAGRGTKAKMFAAFGVDVNTGNIGIMADPSERKKLLEDSRFSVPPYVGHKGWLDFRMDDPRRVDWPMVSRLLMVSHMVITGRIPR